MNVYVDKVGVVNSELIFKIDNKLTLKDFNVLNNLVWALYGEKIKYSHINHLPNNKDGVSEYVYGLRTDTILKSADLIKLLESKVAIDFYIIVK